MFRIKICGVTTAADAEQAVRAGADAIGLNFFAGSRRYLLADQAVAVAEAIPRGRVLRVGVFVNAPAEEVCRLFETLSLDLIQLAGDETPEYLAQLGGRPVMKAIRVELEPEALAPLVQFLQTAESLGCPPALVLIDASQPGQFGGTGKQLDWPALTEALDVQRQQSVKSLPPLVLAGGLTPDNVSRAIATVGPAAVDVASGVESTSTRKDVDLMRRFVAEARGAFDRLSSGQSRGHLPSERP
jgi:phosphoribosylanthranilate isomerase